MNTFSRRYMCALLTLPVIGALAGCGGVEQARARREVPGISGSVSPIGAADEQAGAEEFNYQGWRAFRLTNGMVTVVVVPEMGGRVMEYKLGGHPFLWANPGEMEKAPREGADKAAWRDFGGYRAWTGPDVRWKAPQSYAATIDNGPWTGKITVARGRTAEVEMISPEGANASGMQITRTVQLYGGSSQVRIVEKFTNKSAAEVEWSVRQMAQVPGSVEPGAATSDKARLYLPLSAESRLPNGYSLSDTAGGGQFKVLSDKLLQVSFMGQETTAAADSRAGWVAYVDEVHSYAFLQRFNVSQGGNYPSEGATVALRTAGRMPYMETQLLSPLRKLQPGDTLEVSADWFAARVSGPIVNCTEVAAIREPLKLVRKNDKLFLTGILGVFAPGNLAIILQDGGGTAIGQPTTVKAGPSDEVKLDQEVPEEATAKKLVLELQNDSGTPLGEVGSLEMGVMVAKAEEKAGTPPQ